MAERRENDEGAGSSGGCDQDGGELPLNPWQAQHATLVCLAVQEMNELRFVLVSAPPPPPPPSAAPRVFVLALHPLFWEAVNLQVNSMQPVSSMSARQAELTAASAACSPATTPHALLGPCGANNTDQAGFKEGLSSLLTTTGAEAIEGRRILGHLFCAHPQPAAAGGVRP